MIADLQSELIWDIPFIPIRIKITALCCDMKTPPGPRAGFGSKLFHKVESFSH